MTFLSEVVTVERRFSRSARIDADLNGTPPLTGYVMQSSVRKALETLAAAVTEGQCAFTWTGPYGGGKSCAALLVGSLVGGRAKQRSVAREIAGGELAALFAEAFPGRKPWSVLPLTGRRTNLRTELAAAAGIMFGWPTARTEEAGADDRKLCEALCAAAAERGLLVIVDELGKFFEHAASDGGDIHLLQDLAEAADRSSGRLVVVGILHQSFAQYASRLSRSAKDEWAKIQGRYLDIPFAAAPDEVAALLAKAIQCTPPPTAATVELARRLALSVAERRPVDEVSLTETLADAWPLHPATALILGPVSRQRFAQNERSVFGFLTSAEPHGFQSFLASTTIDAVGAGYAPDRLWDYLVANFGLDLAAGADGARFSLALEAIERAAVLGERHARAAKVAALIELFRNGSGLSVSDAVLAACLPDISLPQLTEVLADLVERAVLIRQPRLRGYALFAGTDFDLDAALVQHRERWSPAELADLPRQLGVGPVAAKRHYFEKGALRTFDVVLETLDVDDVDLGAWAMRAALAHKRRRAAGVIVLLVADDRTSQARLDEAAVALASALAEGEIVSAVGVAQRIHLLREHVGEMFALARVEASHPQLEGDRIARRELSARRSEIEDTVRQQLLAAMAGCQWWSANGRLANLDHRALAFIASDIADRAYPEAPILHSELLNRDRPSSSAMAAARGLAHAMVSRSGEHGLGFTGFPAELGLYLTVLKPFGLHRDEGEGWRFLDPTRDGVGATLWPVWSELARASTITLDALYTRWALPPYGLRRGVMPILALAYLLAHRESTAVYMEGLYQHVLDETVVDRILQSPAQVEIRAVGRTEQDTAFLKRLAERLSSADMLIEPKALPVAAALFRRFRTLPDWSQRTSILSEPTRRIRDAVLKANDPEGLLFAELPAALKGIHDRIAVIDQAVREAEAAYPLMLERLRTTLAERLAADPHTFEGVGVRATAVAGVTADLRFEAFAMRVGEFATGDGDIEGLASLLVHKPSRSWGDREHDFAHFELAKLAQRFREAEAMAELKGREPTAQAISMMVGLDPQAKPIRRAFHVNAQELATADLLAGALLKQLQAGSPSESIKLAALARIFERLQTE